MKEPIGFFVHGIAKPAGSKTAFVYKRKGTAGTDRSHYGSSVTDASKGSKGWKSIVAKEANRSAVGCPWEATAIRLTLGFVMARPKCHFRTGKFSHILRDDAPTWHTTAPDATKLTRGVEDALTGVCWKDDSMIAVQHVTKRYGDRPGVMVSIAEIEEEPTL